MFGLEGAVVVGAIVGGLLPDALRIVKGRHGAMPGWVTSGFFYLGLLVLLVIAVLAVWLTQANSADPLNFVTAMGIGYLAPDAISKLLSTGGSGGDASTAQTPGLSDWWAL
jgi:hypothetical protein